MKRIMRGKKRKLEGRDLKYLCLRIDPDVHKQLSELAGQTDLATITEKMVRHYHARALRKMDKSAYPKNP